MIPPERSLQMNNVRIRGRQGTLHFIRFPTSEMGNFLALAKSKGMANLVTTVCATGGGAFKFEDNFKKVSSCHLERGFETDAADRSREKIAIRIIVLAGGKHELGKVRRIGQLTTRYALHRDDKSTRVLLLVRSHR